MRPRDQAVKEGRSPVAGVLRRMLAGGLMVGLTIAVIYLAGGLPEWKPCLAGWIAAAANAGTAWWLNRKAIRSGDQRFVWWAIGGNGLRIGLFLAIIVIFVWRGGPSRSFLIAALMGYFLFLFDEVFSLHEMSMRMPNTHD